MASSLMRSASNFDLTRTQDPFRLSGRMGVEARAVGGTFNRYDNLMARARGDKHDTPIPDEGHLTDPATDGQGAEKASRLTYVRRAGVATLLLSWLAVIWVSFQTPYLKTCDDQIARVGTVALPRSCRPLSITDAPTLALLVGAGILLFPDLSALEITGLFRLEKQIKEQAKRQEEIVALIQNLEVSQHLNFYNISDAARLGELVALQPEKRQNFDTGAS
jgi:hypothetical protein